MIWRRSVLMVLMFTAAAIGAESDGDERPMLIGRLHPAVVHFPIVCLLIAALAEVLVMRFGERWKPTVRLLTIIGFLGAGVSVLSGWWLADDQQPSMLERHRWLGVWTLVSASLTAASLWLAEIKPGAARWLFRAFLFASVVLVFLTSNLGGDMVYGKNWLW